MLGHFPSYGKSVPNVVRITIVETPYVGDSRVSVARSGSFPIANEGRSVGLRPEARAERRVIGINDATPFVVRRSFDGDPPDGADHLGVVGDRPKLAVLAAGALRDFLGEDGSHEVVCAAVEH